MKERLEAIKKAALEKIEQADAMDSLNDIRVSVLGKKGELTQVLKGMKDVAKEERPIVGQMVNDTRAVIEEALEKEKRRQTRLPTLFIRFSKRRKKPRRSMTVSVKRLARSTTKRLMKFEVRLTNCTKATIRMLLKSAKNCGTL